LDQHTLTLYLVAGGLSLSLSIALLVFAYLQPDTRLMKSSALAILLMSGGFTVSGFGPDLPRWMTVMGTNMILISAGVVLYSGFEAYIAQRQARFDRLGWMLVLLTALPFWYWGLIEPDGHYRSAVFSFAVAAVNLRTAVLLVRAARRQPRSWPTSALALLFTVLTAWMAARGVLSLTAEAPPVPLRGANPTSWTTVFWYIVLVSMMTFSVIWMEFSGPSAQRRRLSDRADAKFSLVDFFRNKLRLLWATVLILTLVMLGQAGVFYAKNYEAETARLTQSARVTNEAFVQHTLQVISQVDTLLQSVRGFYLRTGSVVETENFINALPFDKSTIDNIYLISPQAQLLIRPGSPTPGPNFADRDYYQLHRSNANDDIWISSVEVGLVTGKYHFRITRRISNPDGSFGGIVLATVNPESFTRYYSKLASGSQNIATLVGTADRKLRARAPEPPNDRWQIALDSPLWQALAQTPSGTYSALSAVDGIKRVYAYRQVGDLPLVMVTGFSEADVTASVREQALWLAVGVLSVVLIVVILAILLTVEIRHRNEQSSFMSMLSHELKTPLSVMRMALDGALSNNTRKLAQQSVQNMDAIVERCLEVDRLQQRYVATQQMCNLAELLAECRSACEAPQRVVIEIPALPAFSTDTHLLRIALKNLIDNALKYSAPNSLVQLDACLHRDRNQPGWLVNISNTPGRAGMPDARQVFKKYYRSPGAHGQTGSGLGLYLVHNMARQLEGFVRYAPNAVSVRFELWLPI